MKWLDGKKTYGGIGMMATGALMQLLGIDEASASEMINQVAYAVSSLLEVVGIAVATWGRRVTKAGAK